MAENSMNKIWILSVGRMIGDYKQHRSWYNYYYSSIEKAIEAKNEWKEYGLMFNIL